MRGLAAVLLVVVGCSSSHGADDDASGLDAGEPLDGTGFDALTPASDTGPPPPDAPRADATAEPPPGTIVCGGEVCAPSEICCVLTGACTAPASCVVPPGSDPGACASNEDCDADEICQIGESSSGGLCSGSTGVCRPRNAPGSCGRSPRLCGCDGRTYDSICAADAAGVRIARDTACGAPILAFDVPCSAAEPDCGSGRHCDLDRDQCVPDDAIYACGADAQCPAGETCCELAGICVDPSCPECCAVPPPGTDVPCHDDTECERFEGGMFRDGPQRTFCDGEGCGPGGGCRTIPGSCDGVLAPVCGCDGNTYQNECEAARQRVRVAHTGSCS